MRPLTAAAVLAAAAATATTLAAAIGVRTRERALARAAGPTDDDVCSCRVCVRLRGSAIVTRAVAETRAQDAAAARLRAISPDGED